MNDEVSDLRKMREFAKITQDQMAAHLGAVQSQVSRWEQNPDDAPYKMVVLWKQFCGEVSAGAGLSIQDPRGDLNSRVKLINDYASTAPEVTAGIPSEDANHYEVSRFLASVHRLKRKPRIGVFGVFDVGKSRLLNTLLGGDRLPTSYQPATSITCIIRHVDDRPAGGQREDVWIMEKDFDIDRVDDVEHCQKHRMFAGGFEALRQYGTHEGSGFRQSDTEDMPAYAVVYVDAPVLKGCDLLDLPGYGNSKNDDTRAELGRSMVDAAIYASPAQTFLDQNALLYVAALLRTISPIESPANGLPPLRNFFVVATRADLVGNDFNSIVDRASVRAYQHLEQALGERERASGIPITQEAFKARFFGFSAENPMIRAPFENDLADYLQQLMPRLTVASLNDVISSHKTKVAGSCDAWISRLKTAIHERDKAQEAYRELEQNEPARKARVEREAKRLEDGIANLSAECRQVVRETFAAQSTVATVEALIRRKYDNKKEAQSLAGSFVVEKIQGTINEAVAKRSEQFARELDTYLGEFATLRVGAAGLESIWTFDARGAFMGALTGLSTFGALSAWAAIVAGGSNLGAYLLIPTVVSWLAGIGISVGGTSSVITLVSLLGGPVTIGIGLAVLVGMIGAVFFGDSWQRKLAKKIVEHLEKEGAQKKIENAVDKYWNDTLVGFREASRRTQEEFDANLRNLERLAFSDSQEVLEEMLQFAERIRLFFVAMPWKEIST